MWRRLTCEVCGEKLSDDEFCPACAGRKMANESIDEIRRKIEADEGAVQREADD